MKTINTNPLLERMCVLDEKINNNMASQEEKNEYMQWLYQSGRLTEKIYNSYITGRNAESWFKSALLLGGFILMRYDFEKHLNK